MEELAFELEEKQLELLELIREVENLLRDAPPQVRRRAESYWLGHIKGALSNDHGYIGGSMITMEDTLKELFNEE